MSFQNFSPSSFLSLVCSTFVILVRIQLSLTCSPETFRCGNVTADYPFWKAGEQDWWCGHPELMLTCEEKDGKAKMMIKEIPYQVLDISVENHILKIARDDYLGGICPPKLQNSTTFDSEFFNYSSTKNLTLDYCADHFGHPRCKQDDAIYEDGFILKKSESLQQCNGFPFQSVNVTVPKTTPPAEQLSQADFEEALGQGFEVRWTLGDFNCLNCRQSKGICSFHRDHSDRKWKPVCYCPLGSQSSLECIPQPDYMHRPIPHPDTDSYKSANRDSNSGACKQTPKSKPSSHSLEEQYYDIV